MHTQKGYLVRTLLVLSPKLLRLCHHLVDFLRRQSSVLRLDLSPRLSPRYRVLGGYRQDAVCVQRKRNLYLQGHVGRSVDVCRRGVEDGVGYEEMTKTSERDSQSKRECCHEGNGSTTLSAKHAATRAVESSTRGHNPVHVLVGR